MIDLPPVGTTVVTTIALHKRSQIVPPNTLGMVMDYPSSSIVQVDFGEYGVMFVAMTNLDWLDYPAHEDLLGLSLLDLTQDLVALVAHVLDENNTLRQELQQQITPLMMLAPSRLYKDDGSRRN